MSVARVTFPFSQLPAAQVVVPDFVMLETVATHDAFAGAASVIVPNAEDALYAGSSAVAPAPSTHASATLKIAVPVVSGELKNSRPSMFPVKSAISGTLNVTTSSSAACHTPSFVFVPKQPTVEAAVVSVESAAVPLLHTANRTNSLDGMVIVFPVP